MSCLTFPSSWNWMPSKPHITHTFTINDNNRIEKVLMTFTRINTAHRSQYVDFAQTTIITQLNEELYHIVEKDTKVGDISNDNGDGFYFMGTDEYWSSESSDWPYVMRCMYVGEKYMLEMTVLCYGKDSTTIKESFELLQNPTI